MCPFILGGGGGGGAHLHHLHCFPLFRVDMGGGSFASSTVVCPSTFGVGRGGAHLHYLRHTVDDAGRERQSRTLCGGGGGAHVHYPQCVSLYFEWRRGEPSTLGRDGRRGSFTSHNASPSTLSGGEGGAHLHRSECVSLYLG